MFFPRFAFFVTILAIGILVTNANVLASSQKVTFVVDAEGTIIGQSRGAQQDPGGVIQVGEPVIIDEYNFVGDDDDGEGDFGGDGGADAGDDDNDVLDDDDGSGDDCKGKPSKVV